MSDVEDEIGCKFRYVLPKSLSPAGPITRSCPQCGACAVPPRGTVTVPRGREHPRSIHTRPVHHAYQWYTHTGDIDVELAIVLYRTHGTFR